MCNLWLHMMPIILIRKNNVVKRRVGCFQKVDTVRTPSLWILLKEAIGVLANREKLLGSDHSTTLRTRKHLNELQQALKQQEASKNP
jgi:hypothetical protein